MSAPYEGGCLCGAVRYRLTAEPLTLYACHCTDCQHQSGSAFGMSMVVLKSAIELVRGEPSDYSFVTAEGRDRNGRYCAGCATRLWGTPARYPEIAVIRPGTLDDTSWLEPVGHIWARSAQPWVKMSRNALVFDAQPENMAALIEAWRDRQES
jgi:hypothetical protein